MRFYNDEDYLVSNCKLSNQNETYIAYIPKKFAIKGSNIFIKEKEYFVSEVYNTTHYENMLYFQTQNIKKAGYSTEYLDLDKIYRL